MYGSDLEVRARKLPPTPFNNTVQAVVILQSIRADDVVVVGVLQTEHQARGPIDLTRNSLELHAELKVFETAFIRNQKGEPIVRLVRGGLGDDVRLRGCSRISHHGPFSFAALSRAGGVEFCRHSTRYFAVKIVRDCRSRRLGWRRLFRGSCRGLRKNGAMSNESRV